MVEALCLIYYTVGARSVLPKGNPHTNHFLLVMWYSVPCAKTWFVAPSFSSSPTAVLGSNLSIAMFSVAV